MANTRRNGSMQMEEPQLRNQSSQPKEYRCSICSGDVPFKSRSDWLVHLALSTHNSRVLQNFQQWIDSSKGDLFIVTGLAKVENSMLLEYVANLLRSFENIVFFKPKANISILVCDASDLKTFPRDHHVGPYRINFKAYNQINTDEWRSYFRVGSSDNRFQTQAQSGNENASTSTAGSSAVSAASKRKLAETTQCSPSKSIRLNHNNSPQSVSRGVPISPQSSNSSRAGSIPASYFIDTQAETLSAELKKMQKYIFMSREQIDCRKNIIKHLTDLFKVAHPKCKIIPVGADMLGFNLEHSVFSIYFDSQGFTEAENAQPYCAISETTQEVDRIRTSIFVKLKSIQTEGILSNVQCHGANTIRFTHVLFQLQCVLIMKPFMVAQTARLCKRLYFMDENVAALLNMVTFWSMQHQHFSEVGLSNPYVTYWLVYFFLMKKDILPPVIHLQKACPYEILDGQNNVAFSYDESVFADVINPYVVKINNAQSMVEMLLEWFTYIDDAFGETTGKGENRRHSLVCPRFADLVDKRKFKVVWEAHRDKHKKFSGDQKKVRRLWKQNLIDIGFDESMWGNLLGLKLPDTLCVQHPLYISENISLAFEGPFSKRFFKAVKETRERLSQLLSGSPAVTSLIVALTDFSASSYP